MPLLRASFSRMFTDSKVALAERSICSKIEWGKRPAVNGEYELSTDD
jgi:hypothetical protein